MPEQYLHTTEGKLLPRKPSLTKGSTRRKRLPLPGPGLIEELRKIGSCDMLKEEAHSFLGAASRRRLAGRVRIRNFCVQRALNSKRKMMAEEFVKARRVTAARESEDQQFEDGCGRAQALKR
ncbi:hypothetical protein NDU88_007882 [Pleurodeles waltl]|uniref:Uncharacterized protein n=1 Tax=Pleurodeles waltl TaxID=8319 RepID=A0AAV7NUK1_PLEWA|nr:hypothetical protein NDU88_007882 [Pleurodeles waltl]